MAFDTSIPSLDLFSGGSPSLALGGGSNPFGGLSGLNTGSNGGFFGSIGSALGGVGDFLGSQSGQGLMGLGTSLANLYGMNRSFGLADDQIDILKDQEGRAATAQNLATDNSLAMALQMTTPGTAEHQQVQDAIANSTYNV
jgi:hypothetical protein